MEILILLQTALGTVISAGCVVRIIALLIQSALNPDEKKTHMVTIKNVVIALIITLVVMGSAITVTIRNYIT